MLCSFAETSRQKGLCFLLPQLGCECSAVGFVLHADCVPKHCAAEEGRVFGVSGGTVISGGSAFSGICVGGSAPACTKQCQELTATINKSQTAQK